VREFFVAVVNNSGLTLHIRQLDGLNSHHIVEACFKAFARALRGCAGAGGRHWLREIALSHSVT
jgi:imidazoleglycerol phosphate dehydratase HisB